MSLWVVANIEKRMLSVSNESLLFKWLMKKFCQYFKMQG